MFATNGYILTKSSSPHSAILTILVSTLIVYIPEEKG